MILFQLLKFLLILASFGLMVIAALKADAIVEHLVPRYVHALIYVAFVVFITIFVRREVGKFLLPFYVNLDKSYSKAHQALKALNAQTKIPHDLLSS